MLGTMLLASGALYVGYRIGSRHARGESVGKIIRTDVESVARKAKGTCDQVKESFNDAFPRKKRAET